MKPRNMTMLVLAALLVGLGTPSFAQESALQPEVHAERGIQYVNGGVGQGELAQLHQMARDYDLKLVFA